MLEQLKQNNTILRASNSYKLKYAPFDYYMHYYVIQYAWADRRLGPQTSDHEHEWEISHMIKHDTV